MAGPGELNVLDGHAASGFHLPPFVRSTFVGEAQRDTWVPRINAVRSALARLGVLAVARKLAPATVVSVEQAKVFRFTPLLRRTTCTRTSCQDSPARVGCRW